MWILFLTVPQASLRITHAAKHLSFHLNVLCGVDRLSRVARTGMLGQLAQTTPQITRPPIYMLLPETRSGAGCWQLRGTGYSLYFGMV